MTDMVELAKSILFPLEYPMASMNDAPCRVSADLRAKQRREDQYIAPQFDPHNDQHVSDILSPEISKPARKLLLALEQIEMAERSFGVDKEKAYDSLIQPLKDFRDGCVQRFKDL